MLVIPAIDLLDGKAVRLYKGDYNTVTAYSDDPVELARNLSEQGLKRLHLVDLDAAKGKGKDNRLVISQIRRAVSCEIELGGGIRNRNDVAQLVELGIDWLIIGTALVKKPVEVASWNELAPGRLIAGIDAFDGEVRVAGWLDGAAIKDTDLGRQAKGMGFASIIYTNIARDGTLGGPDIERTLAMAKHSGLPVILSGGIGSMADIEAAATLVSRGVVGFISGKAMYEGRFKLADVLKKYPQNAE